MFGQNETRKTTGAQKVVQNGPVKNVVIQFSNIKRLAQVRVRADNTYTVKCDMGTGLAEIYQMIQRNGGMQNLSVKEVVFKTLDGKELGMRDSVQRANINMKSILLVKK